MASEKFPGSLPRLAGLPPYICCGVAGREGLMMRGVDSETLFPAASRRDGRFMFDPILAWNLDLAGMSADIVVITPWMRLPFGARLRMIALAPLFFGAWWSIHFPKVTFGLALTTLPPEMDSRSKYVQNPMSRAVVDCPAAGHRR